MQIHTRYRLPRRARRWSSLAYALLACTGLGFLGWVLYRTALGPDRFLTPARPQASGPGPAPVKPRITHPPVAVPALPVPPAPTPTNAAPTNATPTPPVVLTPLPPPPTVVSNSAPPAPVVVASNPPAATPPAERLEPPITVLEVQLALNRLGYSAGSIDGLVGSQTRAAIRAFQSAVDLPATGAVDAATRERLRFAAPGLETYEVAEADIDRLLPLSPTWLGKSEQQRLDYETLTELVAEKFQAHPKLIRSLNPQVDWQNAKAGLRLYVPHVSPPTAPAVAASVRIRLSQRILEVRDDEDRLLAHFPCSIARLVEKRPVGTLRVVTIIRNPSYTFNPEIFPESEEGRRLGRKLVLPPGPNNPVGVAWIGLSRSGYGIHGTPRPEEVGRTESHGCFRLANWNAERLAQLVRVGTPVYVEP